MKKRMMLGAVAVATVGLISAFATSAYATPSKSSACSNCHSGAVLTVTATQKSNNGTTASYSVSAPGAGYIAVFSGSTKTTQVSGASGTITVPVGKTYTLHAVKGPSTSSGYGSKSISPVAPAPVPVPDPTPVPVPDPTPTPVPTPDPTVTPVPDPTPVPTPDPTVTPTPDPTPVPTATVGTCYLRVHVMARNGHGVRGVSVTIVKVATGVITTSTANSRGYVSFSKLPRGKYTVSVTLSNGHVLTRTIIVKHHRTYLQLKDHRTRHASESRDRD